MIKVTQRVGSHHASPAAGFQGAYQTDGSKTWDDNWFMDWTSRMSMAFSHPRRREHRETSDFLRQPWPTSRAGVWKRFSGSRE